MESYFTLLPSELIIELFKLLRFDAQKFANIFEYTELYEKFKDNLIKGFYSPSETFGYSSPHINFEKLLTVNYGSISYTLNKKSSSQSEVLNITKVCTRLYLKKEIYISDEEDINVYILETIDGRYIGLSVRVNDYLESKNVIMVSCDTLSELYSNLNKSVITNLIRDNGWYI